MRLPRPVVSFYRMLGDFLKWNLILGGMVRRDGARAIRAFERQVRDVAVLRRTGTGFSAP